MVAQSVAAITLLLLGVSGVAKVMDPDPTAGALRAARLPSSALVARALGVTEAVVALVGLAIGGLAVVPAALLYLGFVSFTLFAIRARTPIQSCGCFGRDDTPPSPLHVAYNAVAAISLFWVAIGARSPIPWEETAGLVAAYLAFAGIGAYASYLLLARLPQTMRRTRSA